jgi:hypothetical protein
MTFPTCPATNHLSTLKLEKDVEFNLYKNIFWVHQIFRKHTALEELSVCLGKHVR